MLPLKAVPNISGRTCTPRPFIVLVSFEDKIFFSSLKYYRYHFSILSGPLFSVQRQIVICSNDFRLREAAGNIRSFNFDGTVRK